MEEVNLKSYRCVQGEWPEKRGFNAYVLVK